jgi:hypothetical protein
MQDPSGEQYVSVSVASKLTEVPVRTLHYWVKTGKVSANPGKHGKLIRLGDVYDILTVTGRPLGKGSASGVQRNLALDVAEDIGASTALESTHERNLAGNALIAHLESLYRDQIAAKDAMIEELRRRAEVAESALDRIQGSTGPDTPPEQPERPWWQFWRS